MDFKPSQLARRQAIVEAVILIVSRKRVPWYAFLFLAAVLSACTSAQQADRGAVPDGNDFLADATPVSAQAASPASDCQGEAPAMSAPFDAELHAICDELMQEDFDALRKSRDPRTIEYGEVREKEWNCWEAFPDRWQFCRKIEEGLCEGNLGEAGEWHEKAVECWKQIPKIKDRKIREWAKEQTRPGLDNVAKIYGPDPARCEKVKQLDGLMPRFEATMQEYDRENAERENESLKALENMPPPLPSFTTTRCELNFFGGGFTCNSDSY